MPRRDEIIANTVAAADFSSTGITRKFAGEIAEVLLVNTSIRLLSFNASDLMDDCFKIIADALIKRNQIIIDELVKQNPDMADELVKQNQKNLVLDIDNTNLTVESIGTLKELIDQKIVKTILMYSIDGVDEKTPAGIELKKYAKLNGVKISFDHPRKRTAIGFFDKNINTDEQKDPANNDFGIKEQETKEQHNYEQNTLKKF